MLVDERDLWPDGKFVITNLIVSTRFLKEHPDVVKKLVDLAGLYGLSYLNEVLKVQGQSEVTAS